MVKLDHWKQATPIDQLTVILMSMEGFIDNAHDGIGQDLFLQRMQEHVKELVILKPFLAKGSWDG